MITVYIQIGTDAIKDSRDWGLIYLDSNEIFEAPMKKGAVTSYPEQGGEHEDLRRVKDAFDYVVTFGISAINSNLENINKRIREFNEALYAKEGDICTMKRVKFVNNLNRTTIVGIPSLISEAKNVYRSNQKDGIEWAEVEWTIRVDNPSECDFNVQLQGR